MIEHHTAVERAEEILSVPGVDACFIGPNDLPWSMGLKGHRNDEHAAAQLKVRDAGKRIGTPVGLHSMPPGKVAERIGQGFQFLACQNDMAFMLSGSAAPLKQIRGG